MTLAQWKAAGGCGISHWAQYEAQIAFNEPEALFEKRELAELAACVPLVGREIARFRAEHADQLNREALNQTAAESDAEYKRCYRLIA